MKISGIISEYNPFHNGHKYHIDKTRQITGCDGLIAVMSGNFTQRGQPALFDKFKRAEMAVSCGADLVVEIPFCFACSSAQYFAEGAITLLDKCRCVDYLSFGSECGDINILKQAIVKETPEFLINFKKYLNLGFSYASAYSNALGISQDFFTPNNILAVEYLKALNNINSKIIPITVKRRGAAYDSVDTNKEFISATGCRKLFSENGIDKLSDYLPTEVYNIINTCYKNKTYTDFSLFDNIILGMLRREPDFLKNCVYAGEGCHNRFYKASFEAVDINSLLETVKTKRYTRTRLARILMCGLVGLSQENFNKYRQAGTGYLRVLGANKIGYRILKEIKESSELSIITNASDYKKLPQIQQEMFMVDIRSSDIFSLGMVNPLERTGKSDFKVTKPARF